MISKDILKFSNILPDDHNFTVMGFPSDPEELKYLKRKTKAFIKKIAPSEDSQSGTTEQSKKSAKNKGTKDSKASELSIEEQVKLYVKRYPSGVLPASPYYGDSIPFEPGVRKGAKVHPVNEDFIYAVEPERAIVCGIDEVGRGPLVGDVVAACIIFHPFYKFHGLTDSKKLTEKQRERLFVEIMDNCYDYGVGRASASEIDELNILNATFLAMKRAYENLQEPAHLVLVDGNKVPNAIVDYCEAVVKGDSRVPEISAASIVAKVIRDHDMYELDKQHPEYGFASHKGYPTPAHLKALKNLPILPCYRKTFGPVASLIAEREAQNN